jgi:hypothetical protein
MNEVIAVFNSLSVRGRSRYTADFAAPHRLKSGRVRSGERGGHKFLEMTRSSKISFRSFIELSAVCAVALVLHFNRCLATEYSETTAHFNGNFDTDNQIYVP